MRKSKLTQACRSRFLEALSETGSVSNAVKIAGTSRTRVYELRKNDVEFAWAWDDAEQRAFDRLREEATRRAVEGVAEPLVSAGKLVRDEHGQPIMVRRYSDRLLLSLLNSKRSSRRKKLELPLLRSGEDAADAVTAIFEAVAGGDITTEEAVELSRLVDVFLKTIEQSRSDSWPQFYGVTTATRRR